MIQERYKYWCESPVFDETTKKELSALSQDEIADRFYTELEFGTSGVRGKLGAGTNRMNIYLIRRLSHALGKMILAHGRKAGAERGVVIACDSRRFSQEFALETALTLAALDIRTFLFPSLRPTPELSFAVRRLGAIAGVNITASHNPKEYNGYKVYWEDGAQLPPEEADKVTAILRDTGWDIPVLSEKEAAENGLLTYIDENTDSAYYESVCAELLRPELCKDSGQELGIIFTPLHGAGRTSVQKVLAIAGFSNVRTVAEQEEADPQFPTVTSPNPEDPGAWKPALDLAEKNDADLLLATDPDADRLGVQCRKSDGTYYHFTGNQIGVLLADYILRTLSASGRLPEDGAVINNIVSTAMMSKIAADYGVEHRIVPVGFKFIGQQIKIMEETGHGSFLFGFEESIGYLKGTYARDKDAVLAATLVCEAALYYKVEHGKTLYDALMNLYSKYGYFVDRQESRTFDGPYGRSRISDMLEALQLDSRSVIGGLRVSSRAFRDDLFTLEFENCGFVKVRPSGTEPKIRFYFCICGASHDEALKLLENVRADILDI